MTTIDKLPGRSRLWFFQCDRFLTEAEIGHIELQMSDFIDQWTSHGAAMAASFTLLHKSLLLIALDESHASASGCGIDKCFRQVDQISKEMGVDFVSRTTVLYQSSEGIQMTKLNQFWAMKKAGLIDASTLVVDTTIGQLADLAPAGLKRFDQTWHMEMWSH